MTGFQMNTRDPGISEELEAFRSTVRKFIAIEVAPNRQRWRQQRCVDRQAWIKAGQAGLLGASIPMEYGGGGGTFRHETVIMEEFARIGSSTSISPSTTRSSLLTSCDSRRQHQGSA